MWIIVKSELFKRGFLNRGPQPTLRAMERFSAGHEKRPLVNSSAMILQNPIHEQGATHHEMLRTTGLNILRLLQMCMIRSKTEVLTGKYRSNS